MQYLPKTVCGNKKYDPDQVVASHQNSRPVCQFHVIKPPYLKVTTAYEFSDHYK